MDKIKLIQDAIANADDGKSKLTDEQLLLPAFNTHKIKHLLNNLCSFSKAYLEVGLHKAGGFTCALWGNQTFGVGVDNWSEFEQGGESKRIAYDITGNPLLPNNYNIIEADCFSPALKAFFEAHYQNFFDIYTYDGNHSFQSQYNGIVTMLPYLKDGFILCVDDTDWADPREATQKAIEDSGLNVQFYTHLSTGVEGDGANWWNGFDVYLLKK